MGLPKNGRLTGSIMKEEVAIFRGATLVVGSNLTQCLGTFGQSFSMSLDFLNLISILIGFGPLLE